jgi:hypothetical protein
MRGSADAVAVARDVASSSPSKPASALDMMRYANPPPIPFACGCRCTCSGERCVRRFLVFSYVRCVFPGIEAASLRSRFRRPCLLVRRSGSCRADLRSFSLSCRVRGPSLLCAARLLFEARFDLHCRPLVLASRSLSLANLFWFWFFAGLGSVLIYCRFSF